MTDPGTSHGERTLTVRHHTPREAGGGITDGSAQRAISAYNNDSLGGRNLTVNEARPKPERSGGFGGSRRRSEPRW